MQKEMFANQTRRPRGTDRDVLERAANKFAERMHTQWSDYSKEKWAKALMKIYSPHLDGYELAKEIEREGFCPDVEMVNELDSFDYEVSTARRQAEAEWVKNIGFTPEFAIGDEVDMGVSSHRPEHGVVTGIRHESAEYEVKAHGDDRATYIIRAENLKRRINEQG